MVQDSAAIAKGFSQVNQFGIGVDGGVDHVYRMNHIALLELIDTWETTSFVSLSEKSLLQPTIGQSTASKNSSKNTSTVINSWSSKIRSLLS